MKRTLGLIYQAGGLRKWIWWAGVLKEEKIRRLQFIKMFKSGTLELS